MLTLSVENFRKKVFLIFFSILKGSAVIKNRTLLFVPQRPKKGGNKMYLTLTEVILIIGLLISFGGLVVSILKYKAGKK